MNAKLSPSTEAGGHPASIPSYTGFLAKRRVRNGKKAQKQAKKEKPGKSSLKALKEPVS
ncbi:MAG: hypothetical protein LBF60_07535 [Treponema sp.]|jgi:hypothetical protein|nr:hypothetical protein [Treponema sp.]